jgi:uncharacterized protein (DUF1697 family)
MTVMVSLLRAVNVGGRNIIRMDALKRLYQQLGFDDPQTYVQSGNVVFGTRGRNLTRLATPIEDALEQTFGFRPTVFLRSCSELRDVVARNPFAGDPGIDGAKLLVTFLSREPEAELREKILALPATSEQIRFFGSEMYIYFPDGMGRSKLAARLADRSTALFGTSRNWNTVCKLLAMAEAMERK